MECLSFTKNYCFKRNQITLAMYFLVVIATDHEALKIVNCHVAFVLSSPKTVSVEVVILKDC